MYSSFSLRNGFSIQPLFACLFCLEDFFFFLMWAIFKVLIQFVTILLLFYFLVF